MTPLLKDTFYCPPAGITGDTLVIGGNEFTHLAHVMRKKEGDTLMAVDGRGNAYEAVISRVEPQQALCSITARHAHHNEPDISVTLGVGILKNPSKFDFLVEKATELGVEAVVPLKTERTIPGRSRSDRWQKLALAAMKQSGRSLWPEVRELTPLGVLLKESSAYDLRLVAHEQKLNESEMQPAGGRTGSARKVLILVGPEGGFSDDEIGLCLGAGFEPLYLGDRRLRTETAAIVALARIMR